MLKLSHPLSLFCTLSLRNVVGVLSCSSWACCSRHHSQRLAPMDALPMEASPCSRSRFRSTPAMPMVGEEEGDDWHATYR